MKRMNVRLSWLSAGQTLAAFWMAVAALSPQARAVVPVELGPATHFAVGDDPRRLAVADFNQDGKPDIVTANSSATVTVLLGLGDGAFARTDFVRSGGACALGVGDFNTDTHLDILTSDGSLLLGEGAGNFVRTNSSWDPYDALRVAVADLNGDGKLDLVYLHYIYATVFFGEGDGSFSFSENCNLACSGDDLVLEDCNGDGKPDLAISLSDHQSTNSLCILTNKGNGAFAIQQYYGGGSNENHYALALKDFNGDGRLDVAVLNSREGSVTVRLNIGSGNFGPANDYVLGDICHPFSPSCVVADDFNGDGTVDMIVSSDSTARALLGQGDGSFVVGSQFSATSLPEGWYPTTVTADFSGEGTPDFAFITETNSVAVLLNRTRPVLEIDCMTALGRCYNQVGWSAAFGAGFTLECSTNVFEQCSWQAFPFPPVLIGNRQAIADWADGPQKFYRLRKP